jgi:N-acetylated-alpha-linked acidic dipeptidase
MRQAVVLLSAFALATQAADSPHSLRGYSQQSAASEIQWEQKFKDIPQEDRLRENMRRLSARPHHVGSPLVAALCRIVSRDEAFANPDLDPL